MSTTNRAVIEQMQRVVNQLFFMKKKDMFEFKGVKFYPSEVHLLLVVAEKRNDNATIIAEELGVTKGAVSQTLKRLEKKGVLFKTKDPYNKNELTLGFTEFGSEAFGYYQGMAKEITKRYNICLEKMSEDQKSAIHKFLLNAEIIFNEML